ncbi:endoribonuclease L-PSP [Colletotrichum paranaense]|uniref:Endoribonuclease L-PSP n=3 Tax=Colletotrichum acutatum species complex TaxID=2707335 RepID=A0A9P9XB89_9PEZI|nr:endoribonuclease L-PSP [Colletotrichum paranaense]XP_060393187.1 endoribonuclease L-PSP [Colletotrichum abscissum]KAK1456812.1 endoribonuclease L-PSP [Colletotrichum melonis]KAI3545477.1 endoribonuclease L-PSP [Colletotrichum abscissum]KAK1479438.1 endoribonuclease L-PSP [Colletotrichum abscissum]KAK1516104.1 endoribonuclease L-PSP [Colletotrichum paranaense]
MSRRNISSGSAFEAQIGYSRAVVSGDLIFVSGTTGYNYATGVISPNIVEQTEQTMENIAAALAEAGAEIKDVVRVRYILPDRNDFQKTWPVLQKYFGDVRPAATMIQAALMEDVMMIEIEVTAKKEAASL